MKKLFFTLFIFAPFLLFSQNTAVCGYNLMVEHYQSINPNYKKSIDRAFEEAKAWSENNAYSTNSDSVLRLPVVVHVLYQNDDENISDDIIKSQIDVLNEDFKRMNADTSETRAQFDTIVGRANFEFFLATKDPQGNPSNGITRTSTTVSSYIDESALYDPYSNILHSMKSESTGGISGWPNNKYINIWVCDIRINGIVQLLGYATPPNNLPNWEGDPPTPANEDGVVIHYELFGRDAVVNMGSPVAFLGRVTTHEMGHYLGLRHVWGDGPCNDDDGIDDTPLSDSDGQNVCNHSKNTCVDSPYDFHDMVENYMDYSDPACQNSFTKGQMGLIHGVLANQRVELPETSANADTTVGIHTIENFQFSVYPQPAKDLLHIELTGANNQSTLQLIDISGKLIWNKDLNSNNDITINLATKKYARGVYFLKFQSFQSNRIEKVILN